MRCPLAVMTLLLAFAPVLAQARPAPPPPGSLAEPGRPGWTVDARSGCWLWNAMPQPGETVRWSGACPRGPAEGEGAGEWRVADGGTAWVASFSGTLREGRMHGQGSYRWANGNRYEGEWRDGLGEPRGTFTVADGTSYEGEFRAGRPHGRATQTWPSGDRYEGEFRDGRRHGQGTLTFADGRRYAGEWRDDAGHGQGTLTMPDGRRYEGEWRNSRQHGRGTHIWPSGDRYAGEWRDDQPDGEGGYWNAREQRWFRGTWAAGCLRTAEGLRIALTRPLSECP